MKTGYARCSTNESKQDIERQVRELKQAGAERVFLEYEHGDAVIKEQLICSDLPVLAVCGKRCRRSCRDSQCHAARRQNLLHDRQVRCALCIMHPRLRFVAFEQPAPVIRLYLDRLSVFCDRCGHRRGAEHPEGIFRAVHGQNRLNFV